MKAYSLRAVNNLVYEEVDYPDCPQGWSIVKVKAAGICSSDIPRTFTKGTYHFPTIPGHEFSGVVEAVGSQENRDLIGKRVGVFPLIPCKKCNSCKKGLYEMCEHYDYIGSRRDGAFAEYVAVPVWTLVEITDRISFEEASMMEPLAVALHGIKKLQLRKGERVAVVGTGMIAFAAAQWALQYGAEEVTVIGRSEEKRSIAESIKGIKYTVSPEGEGLFDSVLEAVGSNSSIDKAINIATSAGKVVLMGNPEGDINLSQNTYWRILRKQISITGTWNSSFDGTNESDWTEVRRALDTKAINVVPLITHVVSQDRLVSALQMMKDHHTVYCKVMSRWNEE